jgi:DNA-binding NtrC family response regulator
MNQVLIVDDQPAVCAALRVLLSISGISCATASDSGEALHLIGGGNISLVIQDMNFGRGETSGQEGIALFRAIRRHAPDVPIILLTAWTSLETAVALIKEGASDYLAKPWDDEKLVNVVQNLLKLRGLQQENARLRRGREEAREAVARRYDLCGCIYAGQEMNQVVGLAATVAGSDAPVLITGPSGTGKEKIAEIIQANSRRKAAPFVRVNVGAIPDDLMESELFGAEPGAFTGSQKLRVGRFEMAHRGTLFLDEIGNLSPSGQMKLLRVLQSGEFERLGSSDTRKVDVRVLSATNTDLRDAIRAGRFREDLFFRLNVIELEVPPLCQRPDDILPLAEHFLGELCASSGSPMRFLNDESRRALMNYRWPGNVRELRNAIHRAVLVNTTGEIGPSDLGLAVGAGPVAAGSEGASSMARTSAVLQEERSRVEQALLEAEGVVAVAASRLGVSRQALYRRMDKLGILMERRPKGRNI